jgi:hypothetical protein
MAQWTAWFATCAYAPGWPVRRPRSRLLRLFGLGILPTWPLSNQIVAKERDAFDARRNEELEADKKRLATVHGPTDSKGSEGAS